ncbi:MAG: tetratricopeptide repeat-containing sulfotransferase family protein [Sphingomonadaceae bacterium]
MKVPEWMSAVDALKAALAQKDRARANAAVANLLGSGAKLGQHWHSISQLMQVSGELTLAHRAIDAFVAEAGNNPRARYAKIVLLTQSNRLADAYDMLKALPRDVPDVGGRAYVLGNIAVTLGRVDEARDHLLIALKNRPGWGPAWLTLANAVNLASDPVGDQLLSDRDMAMRQAPGDQARYHYACGKLHVDRGDHQAAFAAFATGAQILRAETPYSRAGNAANADAAMTGYSEGFFERARTSVTQDTSRPIFVTGLPRSGTTLVEQILASHSDVHDGGELNIAQHVAVAAGGVSGANIDGFVAGGGTLDDLGTLYLHLLTERMGSEGRIVDKTIDVSRFLGLIAAALPDAPLIWMRRDPLDSAWSCFRTFFIHGVGWSYDLSDIALHFMLEDRLLAFWKDQLGDRLLVVPYRELVEQPVLWTQRLLTHCGLAEEAAVHKFHETNRVVATASALQVRRPINRDGLGVAEPYRAMMQPFIEAYRA